MRRPILTRPWYVQVLVSTGVRAVEESSRMFGFGALGLEMEGHPLGAPLRPAPAPPPSRPAALRCALPMPVLARGVSGFWMRQVKQQYQGT